MQNLRDPGLQTGNLLSTFTSGVEKNWARPVRHLETGFLTTKAISRFLNGVEISAGVDCQIITELPYSFWTEGSYLT